MDPNGCILTNNLVVEHATKIDCGGTAMMKIERQGQTLFLSLGLSSQMPGEGGVEE